MAGPTKFPFMGQATPYECRNKESVDKLRQELQNIALENAKAHERLDARLNEVKDIAEGLKALKLLAKVWLWVGGIAAAAVAIIKLTNH